MASPISQNGYWANRPDLCSTYTVPGTRVRLRLRTGAPAEILLYLAERFDNEVEDIDTARAYAEDPQPGIPGDDPSAVADDWSYAERPVRGSTTTLSNHASGTAIDLNATQHPLGVRGTFTAEQVRRIRRILADLDGCVRWGGDYTNRADEMHFEIDEDPDTCARVIARLRKPTPPPAEEDGDVPTPDQISSDLLGTLLGKTGPTVGVALQDGYSLDRQTRDAVVSLTAKVDALGEAVAQIAEAVAALNAPDQS